MDTVRGHPVIFQQMLLSCGILAALLYLGTDLLAGRILKGYSFSAQSISDLSAAGSPTRTLVLSLTLIAHVLLICFGAGVYQAAGQALPGRIVSALIIGNAIVGLVAITFFPTRFGERPNFGSPNVILMFLSVVFFVLAMAFGAVAFSSWMRFLSVMIPGTYVILTVVRLVTVSKSTAGMLIGAQERTMLYSFLVWLLALAVPERVFSACGQLWCVSLHRCVKSSLFGNSQDPGAQRVFHIYRQRMRGGSGRPIGIRPANP